MDGSGCEKEDVTNRFLAKLCSAENLVTLVVVVFSLGVMWNSLNKNVEAAEDEAEAAVAEVKIIKEDVSAIKTDVAVLKANSASAEFRATKRDEELKEQRRDIKNILEILRRESRD